MEVRRQHVGISSFLLPSEAPGSKLGGQVWQQAPYPLIHLADPWKSFYQVHGLGLCFSLALAWPKCAGFCFPFYQQILAQKRIVSSCCLPLGVGS